MRAHLALFLIAGCSSSSENAIGGTPGSSTLLCGAPSCKVGEEKCCFDTVQDVITTTACESSTKSCPAGASQTSCDDAADCVALGKPGTVCCASLSPTCTQPSYQHCILATTCASAANCASGDTVILCDPGAAESCPDGRVCNPESNPKVRTGYCNPY